MSSPFDDLLRELDELPPSGEGGPPRDVDREQALRLLMQISKKLEEVAIKIDPTPDDHPLHGITLPDPARERLQSIVADLMDVQKTLNLVETSLTEPTDEPSQPKDSPSATESDTQAITPHEAQPVLDLPPLQHTPKDEPATPSPASANAHVEVFTPERHEHKAPIATPEAATVTAAASDTASPSISHITLEREKAAFNAYKAQWEAAFNADPSLRQQHSEVLAYYHQMESYFQQMETFLAHAPGP